MINHDFHLPSIWSIIALIGFSASGEQMSQPTLNGEPAVYLDVDVEGRILEVDLLTQTAKQIGDISSIHSESFEYHAGLTIADRQYALLFFHEVRGARYPPETPYLFSRSKGTLERSPISFLLIGDGAIVPLDSHSIFVSESMPETKDIARTIYDAVTNQKRGSFDFRVSPYTIKSKVLNDSYAYLAETTGPHVRKVNISSGAVEQEFDVIDLVGTDEPGIGRNVWIRALYRNFALVKRRYTQTQEVRLFLIDLDNERVVAESDFMPNFYGRFLLYEDRRGNLFVTCIENSVIESKLQVAGVLNSFLIEGDSIAPTGFEHFDPESELVVTDGRGVPLIIPKYRFDYLSMREVQRQIFRRVGGAGQASVVARGRVRDEVIDEFNKAKETGLASGTMTHLEIR